MSIFNDKALKGVSEAVAKIMDEELKGNQHKIDANKNGKVDAHDFKLLRGKKDMKEEAEKMAKKDHDQDGKVETGKAEYLGSRIRAAKMAGKLKEEEQLDEYETKGGVYKNKGSYGTSHNSDDEDDEKKTKGYGARQNANQRGKSVGAKLSKNYDEKDKDTGVRKSPGRVIKTKTGLIHKMNESRSFTEMLHLYNESGIEVIAKIMPEKVKFGDTEVEVIDANIVNGAVGITVAEEVDNETFTKEVEAQKEKNAGKGKKAEVAKASVQAVEVQKEEVEQIDEISADLAGKYLLAPKGKGANKYKTGEGTSRYPNADTMIKHGKSMKRALQRADTSSLNKKPSYYKEEEQLDEISKKTLGSYIKAASHDVAAKGAFTRHFADKSRAETAAQRPDLARKSMKQADKVQDAGMKRRANMAKAVDRLTKEDVEQIDERTLTSGETAKKEDYVKGMKKSVSGFKARYGDRAKEVMYATATKMAKKD